MYQNIVARRNPSAFVEESLIQVGFAFTSEKSGRNTNIAQFFSTFAEGNVYTLTETLKDHGFINRPAVSRPINLATSARHHADIIVCRSGKGDFTTIAEALKNVTRKKSSCRTIIYVKSGIYKEYISISHDNVTLIGDGINKTLIVSDRNEFNNHGINNSSAMTIYGKGFVGIDLTFRNNGSAGKGRAVALRSDGDMSTFYRCSFVGHQDTLYVRQGRQFFRECEIYGTIDFIFGDATALFQNCIIKLRKPPPGQSNVVTAQGRYQATNTSGISIINSTFTTVKGFDSGTARCYLGRPWKKYSRTAIMESYIGDFMDSAGWMQMDGTEYLDTLVFREYANRGPGASTMGRVKWPGFKVMDRTEAMEYTVDKHIQGLQWLPDTKVPFFPYLLE